MEPKDKLKYARTVIPMLEPFYGSLMFNAQTEFVDDEGTAWTDGRVIKFTKQFADSLSKQEFAGVLLHEVLHVAYAHIPRMKQLNYNQMKWNVATDYVINLQINELARKYPDMIKLPEDCLLDFKWINHSADEVYHKLPDNLSHKDIAQMIGEDLQKEIASSEKLKESESTWKSIISQAVTQARMQGSLPAGIERCVNEILYPKVDWRDILKEFIQAFPVDYDFSTRDRRFLSHPVIIPSMSGERISGVVAIDTSGSIDDETLKVFLSETFSILQTFNRVDLWVISCDTQIHNPQKIESAYDLESYKPKGGGGTDFRPIFKWVESELGNADFVVVFTDGYGQFGEEPNMPVLWVLTTDKEVPFGRAVRY